MKMGMVMGGAALVLAGWVAGAASGCSSARADDVATETCTNGFATHMYSGMKVVDMAGVVAIGNLSHPGDRGDTSELVTSVLFRDGVVTAGCASNVVSVTFVLR